MLSKLRLEPGKALGPFKLGMPIGSAIKVLLKNGSSVPEVQMAFDHTAPLERPIALDLHSLGTILQFDPASQRLSLIDIYDTSKAPLEYQENLLWDSSGKASLSFGILHQLLGPTYPGVFDEKRSLFTLSYPGLSLIASKVSSPLNIAEMRTTTISHLLIHVGSQPHSAEPPALKATEFYMEPVQASLRRGIFFAKRKLNIVFGSSPQDVLSDFGAPSAIFPKEMQKTQMYVQQNAADASDDPAQRIATPNGSANDYVYNYFELGLDVVFSGVTHRVIKLILHTNSPTAPDFNRYQKCNFSIPFKAESVEEKTSDFNSTNNLFLPESASLTPRPTTITADSKWSDVLTLIGSAGRPMVKDSAKHSQPFGPTYFYAFEGLIFEVMKNGYIASVTLFTV